MVLARWQATITDEAGNVQPAASVTVRSEGVGNPLANLFTDREGVTPTGNPITADGDGYAAFHVAGGAYRITAELGAFSQIWRYVAVGLGAESDEINPGVPFTFDAGVNDADPGSGDIRFNNSTPGLATFIYISDSTADAVDVSAWIDTFDDGGAGANRGVITLTGDGGLALLVATISGAVVDATGYKKIPIVVLSASAASTFTAGRRFGVTQDRAPVNGVNGTNGITPGLAFTFDSSTSMADPGTGDFRFNDATLASVTAAAFDDQSSVSGNPDVSAAVLAWDDSTNTSNRGYLLIKKTAATQNFALYRITGASTDNSGWTQLALTHVASAGSFANADPCTVEFSPAGNIGATGASGTGSPSAPQGRLTLATAVPVMTTTQGGKTTIFYAPYIGQFAPLYDGANFTMTDLGGELSQTTTDTTKSPAAVVQDACYDLFLWDDNGTKRCTRGPAWSKAATITVTIATPAVVTWTGHGLQEGDPVVFTTTGALPTGITAGTTYYVGRSPAANTFNLSTTVANAAAGTFVTTTGAQSGTHTGTNRTRARGTGAGTSELVQTKGVNLNANNITNGPAASRGTYVGTVRSNGSSQIDWILGALATGGTSAVLNIWNAYNRVPVSTFVQDDTNSWNYSTATWRSADNSVAMRVSFVTGLAEDSFDAKYWSMSLNDGGTINLVNGRYCGIGYGATNALASGCSPGFAHITTFAIAGVRLPMQANFVKISDIGSNYCQAIEYADVLNASITTWYGDNNSATTQQNGLFFSGRF